MNKGKLKTIHGHVLNVINIMFLFFSGYTLYGALRNSLINMSRFHDYIFILLWGIIIVVGLFFYSNETKKSGKKFLLNAIDFLNRYRRPLTIILFLIVMITQVIILIYISAPIGWDVGVIHEGTTQLPSDPARINRYLSANPNNSFFTFIMYGATQILNRFSPSGEFGETWLAWQLFNTQLLNLGFVFIFLSAKELFNKSIAYLAFYLAFLPLALSPWILVPYTDVVMITVTSLIFWLYALIINNKGKNKGKVPLAVALGLLTAVSYLLKPSSVIFLIAFMIIKLSGLVFKQVKMTKRTALLSLIFFVSLAGGIGSFNLFEENQNLITINEENAKPWTHFVMMGLRGNGGYSPADSAMMNSLPDQDSKREYARNEIVNRLQDHGLIGYPRFLLSKHTYNTARGDFSWGADGSDQINEDPPRNYLDLMLRDIYYQQGEKTDTLRGLMHLLWIVTLIGLVLAVHLNDKEGHLSMLKLGIIGAFIFLLLFEGGRSRYLIQFLSMFYLLAANGLYYRYLNWIDKQHSV